VPGAVVTGSVDGGAIVDGLVVAGGSDVVDGAVMDGDVALGGAVDVGSVVGAGVDAGPDTGGRIADESSFPPHAATARSPARNTAVFIGEV